jgi:hypothetical protein
MQRLCLAFVLVLLSVRRPMRRPYLPRNNGSRSESAGQLLRKELMRLMSGNATSLIRSLEPQPMAGGIHNANDLNYQKCSSTMSHR